MRSAFPIACTLLGAALLVVAAADDNPALVQWEEDLDAARKQAARTGKPLFVVFRCER